MNKLKIFWAATLLILSMNSYAGTWTVSTTGTIGRGYDYMGVFGEVGRDLSGLSFRQSVVANTDPSLWEMYDHQHPNIQELHFIGPSFTTTVTVDGHTSVFSTLSTERGTQYMANLVTAGVTGNPELIYTLQTGPTQDGSILYSGQYAVSYTNAFVPELSYDQRISVATGSDFTTYSEFRFQSVWFIAGSAYGAGGNVERIDVNVFDVPEPATAVLFLIAVLALAAVHLRRPATQTRQHVRCDVER